MLRKGTGVREMQQLTKDRATLAESMRALGCGGALEAAEIDAIEELARRVLREVAAVRRGQSREIGEITGRWPAYNASRQ